MTYHFNAFDIERSLINGMAERIREEPVTVQADNLQEAHDQAKKLMPKQQYELLAEVQN